MRIVTNRGAAIPSSPISLSREPVFTLGWDESHQFGQVSTGAILLDGSVVVGDPVAGEVLLISPAGTVRSTIGSRGQGPGEFEGIHRVLAIGEDTIVVQEPLGGLVLFARGEFLKEWRADRSLNLSALGVDSVGRIVLGPPTFIDPFPDGAADRWTSLTLPGLRLTTEELETLATIEHADRRSGNMFFPQSVVAVSGRTVAVARQDRPEITWLDRSGAPVQISRWQEKPGVPGDSLWRAIAQGYHARWDRRMGVEAVDQSVDEARARAGGSVPLFGEMLGDPEGGVWLGDYVPYWGDPPRSYRVFAPGGALLGRIQVPRDVRVLAVGGDRVLAVRTNELGIPAVAVYGLER